MPKNLPSAHRFEKKGRVGEFTQELRELSGDDFESKEGRTNVSSNTDGSVRTVAEIV